MGEACGTYRKHTTTCIQEFGEETWAKKKAWKTKVKRDSNINLLKPTGYVKHQQFNIQQLYVLPTLYLFVLYLSENKQRLVPLTA